MFQYLTRNCSSGIQQSYSEREQFNKTGSAVLWDIQNAVSCMVRSLVHTFRLDSVRIIDCF